MASIFISYSSKSKDKVNVLAQDLEMAGHQIWFDHKLTGGEAWWDQILENIRQSDLFIFALTPEALDSYPCKLEYCYAHSLGKDVLPVLLTDGVSINLLPPELTTIQFVDYRSNDKQAAFLLMNALNSLRQAAALPDPLPEPPPVPISYIGNLKDQVETTGVLSFEEQASLVFKLKEHLDNPDEVADIVTLFKHLRRRDDLFARIGEEIDAVLEGLEKPVPQPVLLAAPEPVQVALSQPLAQTQTRPAPAPPQRVTVARPNSQSSVDGTWSAVVMLILAGATFFVFPVGIVAGIIGLRSEATRNQGIALLVFGAVLFFFYVAAFMNSFYYY